MKLLSERDENMVHTAVLFLKNSLSRNEATLWKRWERSRLYQPGCSIVSKVGMKLLSERDENAVPYNYIGDFI